MRLALHLRGYCFRSNVHYECIAVTLTHVATALLANASHSGEPGRKGGIHHKPFGHYRLLTHGPFA